MTRLTWAFPCKKVIPRPLLPSANTVSQVLFAPKILQIRKDIQGLGKVGALGVRFLWKSLILQDFWRVTKAACNYFRG